MKNNLGFSTVLLLILLCIVILLLIGTYVRSAQLVKKLPVSKTQHSRIKADMDKKLFTQTLSDGSVQITDTLNRISFVVPETYNISGDAYNYTVSFHGIHSEEGPGPRDFSQLRISLLDLQGSLYNDVVADFNRPEISEKISPDTNAIVQVKFGNLSGYSFKCPFLVSQTCIYLKHPDFPKKSIFILKSFADERGQGYEQELDKILSSIEQID